MSFSTNLLKKIISLIEPKTEKKLVLFLSDDWGSVRIKSKEDQNQLISKGYDINNRFDLFDSLETNKDLELLFEVLTKHKDANGNHPIITAVSNVANPDFEKIRISNFANYYYEIIDQTYNRYPDSDKVLSLVKEGIKNNIFIPQSHGREHLQTNWYLNELQEKNSFARKVFENEFFFFGAEQMTHPKRNRGIGAAFDVINHEDLDTQFEIIESGLKIFENLYGFKSSIFTPPAMFYNPAIEPILINNQIKWLDVGRMFKIPQIGGSEKFQFNYLGRKKKSGLKVLVRNTMFESNMSETDNGVNRCLNDIEQAFKAKQPAIISNHRASFVGRINPKNRENGLNALDSLFKTILVKWPDVEFVSIEKFNSNL